MRLSVAPRPFVLFATLAVLAGCTGSVEGEVNTGKKEPTEVSDFDKPMDTSAAPVEKTFEAPPADAALLGARQDLSFKGARSATCECLAVAVGQPNDPAFGWAGERPHTNRDNQLVVALSSAGIACPAPGSSPIGASYWGYESVGNDVVVVVEQASSGRPVASGAIIPRPLGSGQVFVRPVDKKLPYGRPLSGAGDRCQIGTLPTMSGQSASPSATVPPASSGTRIRTDEAEPMSPRTEIP